MNKLLSRNGSPLSRIRHRKPTKRGRMCTQNLLFISGKYLYYTTNIYLIFAHFSFQFENAIKMFSNSDWYKNRLLSIMWVGFISWTLYLHVEIYSLKKAIKMVSESDWHKNRLLSINNKVSRVYFISYLKLLIRILK